jgi:hypothetical protein
MTVRRIVPIVATLALPFAAAAAPFAFATTYTFDLDRIDLNSGATVTIGNIGFVAKGLAATSAGTLYATTNAGTLFNVTGGIPVPVAALGPVDVGAMATAGRT